MGDEAVGEEERREKDATCEVTWSRVPSQSSCDLGIPLNQPT
jgi:hypothetical protein